MTKPWNRSIVALLTLFLPLLASCDTMTNSEENSGLQQLSGHWVLNRVKSDTNIRIPTDKGPVFSISLSEDGKAYGKVACNRWNSTYTITGSTLQIGIAATTKKRCIFKDPYLKTLEQRFLSTLKGGVAFKTSEIELALQVSDSESWYLITQAQ